MTELRESRPTPLEQEFPESWYGLADPSHFWMEWRVWAFLEQLRSLGLSLDDALAVLDVGAGNGALRAQLEAATRWTIDISDTNPAVRNHCIPGRGESLLYDVAERAPERVGRYEVVLLFDVIEHALEPSALLRDAAAHLRPGGHLFVNVPALPAFHSRYDRIVGHHRRYTRKTLRADFERAGLRVVDNRYWGLLLLPVLVTRWLVHRGEPRDAEERERWIRDGFEPPSRAVGGVLRALARLETQWLAPAPLGTSLLCAGRKER
jgi:SAM-dependent methyltransferase